LDVLELLELVLQIRLDVVVRLGVTSGVRRGGKITREPITRTAASATAEICLAFFISVSCFVVEVE
jgi:hypothetical protein